MECGEKYIEDSLGWIDIERIVTALGVHEDKWKAVNTFAKNVMGKKEEDEKGRGTKRTEKEEEEPFARENRGPRRGEQVRTREGRGSG